MKKMNVYRVLFAAFICIVFLPVLLNAAEDKEKSILIVTVDYPPYEFEHPEGDLKGFDVEVTEEALRRAGIKATYQFYPWVRCLAMVAKGEATAALSAAKNSEREKTMIFSDPISSMTDVLMVHKDYNGPQLAKLKDLGKLKLFVGVSKGTFTEKRLIEYNIPHDVSPTDDIVLQKLVDKRVDVMPGVLEYIVYSSKKKGVLNQLKWFIMEDVKTTDFHLPFSKQWPGIEEIVSVFNEKLAEMKKDGTYDVIHNKYR